EALEAELGVSLFTRSPSGLRPTATALRLRPHLDALGTTAEALVRDATAADASYGGTVRITTSETVAMEILPRLLRELQPQVPTTKFELSVSNGTEDLLSRQADIAIRTMPTVQQAILAKKVGEIEMGLYGSRAYFRERAVPRTQEELRQHAVIGYDELNERVRSFASRLPSFERNDFTYMTDNVTLYAHLVDAGCGIGLCRVVENRPDRVRVLAESYRLRYRVWVAMHENLKASRTHRAVFTHMTRALRQQLLD
ncbi:MAG TPA: LysR family transcriptional regulator, partial [Kofleriaceae bacterium]